jgi:hypothetical protein
LVDQLLDKCHILVRHRFATVCEDRFHGRDT